MNTDSGIGFSFGIKIGAGFIVGVIIGLIISLSILMMGIRIESYKPYECPNYVGKLRHDCSGCTMRVLEQVRSGLGATNRHTCK